MGTLSAATFTEDFSSAPATRGWRTYGDASLFQWNASSRWLEVTWDSSRTNSYFRFPLGTILGKQDDFVLGFDLLLQDDVIGVNPAKPYPFEVALGFQNSLTSTNAAFLRGMGPPVTKNLVEFDYFPEFSDPDAPISATVWPAITSTNGAFNYANSGAFAELILPTNLWMRVEMRFVATNRSLTTTVLTNAQPFTATGQGAQLLQLTVLVKTNFTDFRTDLFSISSYSDAGGSGSLLAHGIVDNVSWTVPDPPVSGLTISPGTSVWQARFLARSNWVYTLENSTNFQAWQSASVAVPGSQGWLQLTPASTPPDAAFYRVKAERP
jgi:hypothetical protein